MTTIYAQHIFQAISVGQTGHHHEKHGGADEPFALDCVACEPFLAKDGWVYDKELIPLTNIQEREAERVEREGNLAVKHAAKALATATAKAMLETDDDDSDEPVAVAPKRRGRPPKVSK